MIRKALLLFFLMSNFFLPAGAQENLLDQLKSESKTDPDWQRPTSMFKAVRLINGHTVETRRKGNLEFLISHRFGRVNTGAYQFFGMDQANMRLGLDYSLEEWLTLGIGRNSFNKMYDGFVKIGIHRQGQSKTNLPISIVWVSNTSVNTLRRPELPMNLERRLRYSHQFLLASKLNQLAAIQLMPTYVHQNLVSERNGENGLFALGAGASYRITRCVHLTMEYYHRFTNENNGNTNPVSFGVDIETGGHVFQLHITNSQQMTETGFIPSTTGDFFKGDIHFGFNITRNFQLAKPD